MKPDYMAFIGAPLAKPSTSSRDESPATARASSTAPQWDLAMRAVVIAHAGAENRCAGGVAVGWRVEGGLRRRGRSSITPLTWRRTRAPSLGQPHPRLEGGSGEPGVDG